MGIQIIIRIHIPYFLIRQIQSFEQLMGIKYFVNYSMKFNIERKTGLMLHVEDEICVVHT